MPSFRPLPQELVDKRIDELGEDYRDSDYNKCPDGRVSVTHEALHACTLVSENCTGSSRAHLFKEVKVTAGDSGRFLIPSETVMPYVTKLKMRFFRSPSKNLLRAFYAAPVVCLGITGGIFGPLSVGKHLLEFIAALFATLQTVAFK